MQYFRSIAVPAALALATLLALALPATPAQAAQPGEAGLVVTLPDLAAKIDRNTEQLAELKAQQAELNAQNAVLNTKIDTNAEVRDTQFAALRWQNAFFSWIVMLLLAYVGTVATVDLLRSARRDKPPQQQPAAQLQGMDRQELKRLMQEIQRELRQEERQGRAADIRTADPCSKDKKAGGA